LLITAVSGQINFASGGQKELEMGTIIEFPADAASRRRDPTLDSAPREMSASVLILPVIRIERAPEETSNGSGPEQRTAPRRRRRRR
jgi:hypothetical protein